MGTGKPQVGAVERQFQVDEQMSEQGRLLSELAEKVESLSSRLHGVLIPTTLTQPGEDKVKEAVELVQLASLIRQHNESIREAIDYLKDIESRIEL